MFPVDLAAAATQREMAVCHDTASRQLPRNRQMLTRSLASIVTVDLPTRTPPANGPRPPRFPIQPAH